MKTCKIEGCNRTVWGKNLCKGHYLKEYPPKPLKKSHLKVNRGTKTLRKYSPTTQAKRELKQAKNKELHKWFVEAIWNKRPHYSEISGKYLGKEPKTTFFHHIYPKSRYGELEFKEENIILLTPDEHAEVESNPLKFTQINTRRELLRQKLKKSTMKAAKVVKAKWKGNTPGLNGSIIEIEFDSMPFLLLDRITHLPFIGQYLVINEIDGNCVKTQLLSMHPQYEWFPVEKLQENIEFFNIDRDTDLEELKEYMNKNEPKR